jgi:hypothetical protein
MNGYLSISGLICEWEGVQESKMETTKWIGVYDCSSSCFLNDTSFYWIYIYIYIYLNFILFFKNGSNTKTTKYVLENKNQKNLLS